jgi:thiol-disulfide isomerase/thioredoxin
MNKNKRTLWLAAALVAVLVGAYFLYDYLGGGTAGGSVAAEGSQEDTSAQPVQAPDFTVYDPEGNEVQLSDFAGKPVILNFWASWCGPCKSEMPDFDEAYAEYGDEIAFLMVNMTTSPRESREAAEEYVAEEGFSFPVYYDTDGDAATTYSARSLPTSYFIDAEGYGVAYAVGALSAEGLQQGIDMLLGEE